MKTRLLLPTLLTFSFLLSPFFFHLAHGQVPEGFNYQAVATYLGSPVTEAITVRITIQATDVGGETFWIEDHLGVIPNSQGLFNIVIGTGVKVTGSTANAFADIDWSVSPKYLKTDINYLGWKPMGVSKLQSVPYAMVAKNSTVAKSLASPVDKIGIKGVTTNMEEALFEVKNKNGQIVFAVYNEGVRIYVDDGSKGSKGGFAIGGFDVGGKGPGPELLIVDPTKIRMYIDKSPALKSPKGGFAIGGFGDAKADLTQTYMRITNDSTKFFINDDPAGKGSKGGFAIGGFSEAKGFKNYFNVESPLATPSLVPGENRILFHPQKNAFLVGKVLITNVNDVGENSFVSGYESKAKGMYSQSLGYKTIALGNYSSAIGKNAEANSDNSFAFGDGAKSTNIDSYAFGAGAVASGQGSFGFGSFGRDTATYLPNTQPTEASGDYSFAIGLGAKASGKSSTAIGIQTSASGDAAVAIGVSSRAEGDKSMALNIGWAAGNYSLAYGSMSKAEGEYSIAIGRGITKFGGVYNLAAGDYSIALGYSRVYGAHSVGIGTADVGTSSLASNYGVAIGNSAKVTGEYATAIGTLVTASSVRSFVVGTCNVIAGNATVWNATDPLFVVGNGSSPSSPSNAFTVLKNSKTGVGTADPQYSVEAYGTNASLIAHYSGQARGGLAALSGGRVSLLTTFSGDDLVFGYSPTTTQSTFSTDFVERMRLSNSTGNLTIGTAIADGVLNVEKWDGLVAMFNRRSTDGVILSIRKDNVQQGSISIAGSTVSYNAFTGSHYGVTNETIEEGKLVMMNGENSWLNNSKGSEILYGISEVSKANDPAAMGSYLSVLESSKPYSSNNPYLIMAAGNGVMWVVDNGEDLKPGDMLISSDVKGHAMKDKGEFPESYVVAKVAEPINWQTVSETVEGKKHYKVSVLFTSFVRNNIGLEANKVSELNNQVVNQQTEINNLKSELQQIKALLQKQE